MGRHRRALRAEAVTSTSADAGELDDLAPFFRFVGNQLAEVVWRTAEHQCTHRSKPLLYCRIGKGSVGFGVEFFDDIAGCAMGRTNAPPGAGIESGDGIRDWRHF